MTGFSLLHDASSPRHPEPCRGVRISSSINAILMWCGELIGMRCSRLGVAPPQHDEKKLHNAPSLRHPEPRRGVRISFYFNEMLTSGAALLSMTKVKLKIGFGIIMFLTGCSGSTPPTQENMFATGCIKAADQPALTPIPFTKKLPKCQFKSAAVPLYLSPFSEALTVFSQGGGQVPLSSTFVILSEHHLPQPTRPDSHYYAFGYILNTSHCLFMENVFVRRNQLVGCTPEG